MIKMNVKTIIVVATVVVCVLAAICGWCMTKENCAGTVAGIEMTQTDSDEIIGDHDLYMSIKPYYNYNGMHYNTPVSFSTYQDYIGGGVSIPLHTRHRVTDDNNGTLSVVLLIVIGIVFGGMLIYLFIELKRDHSEYKRILQRNSRTK